MRSSQKYKNSVFRNIYEQPYNERTRIKLYNSAKGKPIIFIFVFSYKSFSGSMTHFCSFCGLRLNYTIILLGIRSFWKLSNIAYAGQIRN